MPLLLKGFTDHTIHTGEVEIGYSEGPDNGPPLLLLHGVTSRRDSFVRVVDSLIPNFRVITMDQRGHGYSGHTPGHYLREDHARDIACILENVCKEPACIWGHSMGGANALAAADDRPELVSALLIEDSGLYRGAGKIPRDWAVAATIRTHLELLDAGLDVPELTEKIRRMSPGQPDFYAAWKAECLRQMDIEIIRNLMSGLPMGTGDTEKMLSRVTVPLLYLQADTSAGGRNTDEILDRIIPKKANFTIKKITGAGHNIHREHTELLLPVVLPWLAELYKK